MALQSLSFDFALMDLNLPDGESLELLRDEKIPSNTLTILMTAEGGIKSAVEAMRLGAADYLSKPFDIEEISILLLKTEQQRKTAFSPLATVEKGSSVDVSVNVSGGGGIGQAGAIRHGLSRALEKMDSELRVPLKRAGHLRRDPRKIERKKTGQPGARKRFQFSKR